MSHSKSCILAGVCKSRDTDTCTRICPYFIAVEGRLSSAGVPSEYRLLTASTSPVRESQPQVYKSIDAYISTFSRQFQAPQTPSERIKSLYFVSSQPGTGKSVSASAVLNEWVIRHYLGSISRNIRPHDRPAYYLSVNVLQSKFNRAYSPGSQDTRDRAGDEVARMVDIAKAVPFLVVDDLAVRKATASFIGLLYDLLDHRTSHGLPAIYTSNLTIAELKEFFRDEDPQGKVVDRIRDMTVELRFDESEGSKRGMRR